MSIVVLVAAVVALFLGPQAVEARVYSYALEVGQTRVYAVSMQMSLRPQGFSVPGEDEAIDETITGKMTMTVVDVAADGSAAIEMTMTEMTGGASAAGPSEPIQVRVSKTGEVLSVEGGGLPGIDLSTLLGGSGSGSSSSLGSMNIFPVYPSDAIAPGDSWTEDLDVPLPFGDGKMHITSSGKHEGFEDTRYGRAARVRMTYDAPMDLSFTFADLMGMLSEAFTSGGTGSSGTGTSGPGKPPGTAMPPGLDRTRMVIGGRMDGDMVARAIPETGDLVGMQVDMDIDISMRVENVPQELSVLMSGMPSSFEMVGDITMTLDRIA